MLLSSANVADAHVAIKSVAVAYIVVDHLVEDGADLGNVEDAAVVVQISFVIFLLPET